jgi:hypothetical protein
MSHGVAKSSVDTACVARGAKPAIKESEEERDWKTANLMDEAEDYLAFQTKHPKSNCLRVLSGEASSSMGLIESRIACSVSVGGETVHDDCDDLVKLGLLDGDGDSYSAKTVPNTRIILKSVGGSWRIAAVTFVGAGDHR